MRLRNASRLLFAALSGLLVLVIAQQQTPLSNGGGKPPAAPQAGATKRALLIGCSFYENLADKFQLKGPEHDVLLMRELLEKQFGFPAANIVVLNESFGKKDPQLLPTRVNIARAFQQLAAAVQKDDQVVILMAGHGSQQPEAPAAKDPEPDGLDEIFLPRDVGKWDDGVGQVKNAIVDDELKDWLGAVQAKEALIWIVFDCCHSGTMIRGKGERERQLDAITGLSIPRQAVQKAQELASKRPLPPGEATRSAGSGPVRNALPPGLVAFYACKANEVTVELDFAGADKIERPHGLFTWTLCQELTRATKSGGRSLSYGELMERVRAQYAALDRSSPTPLLEASKNAREREVLGEKLWEQRFRPTLRRDDDDNYKVSAGTLQGLTAGTILAVYAKEAAEPERKVLGHVRITRAAALSAEVEPVKFGETPLKSDLPTESPCEVVQYDYGDQRLRLAVDTADHAGKPIPQPELAKLRQIVSQLAEEKDALVQTADKLEQAQWLVRWHADKVYLLPAWHWLGGQEPATGAAIPKKQQKLFGPFDAGAKLPAALKESLQRIVRVENLKRFSANSGVETSRQVRDLPKRVTLDVQMLRYEKGEPRPLAPEDSGLTLRPGDEFTLKVKNTSRFTVDLTVLYVQSDFEIVAWFPDEGELNDVPAGKEILLEKLRATQKTVGLEHVIVIAVKGQKEQPLSFAGLAQPGLKQAQERSAGDRSALDSPLGQLFSTALYGKGNTRAVNRAQVEQIQLQLLPIRLEVTPTPKN